MAPIEGSKRTRVPGTCHETIVIDELAPKRNVNMDKTIHVHLESQSTSENDYKSACFYIGWSCPSF